MDTSITEYNGTSMAIVSSDGIVIKDVQSAIDLFVASKEEALQKLSGT